MSTATQDAFSALDPRRGVLRTLRALAPEPPGSIADALTTTDTQAAQLQGLLANQSEQLPLSITRLIPNIIVEHIDYIPVSGTSFWANGHWHIHIRTSDPIDVQAFTGLHELKHIIDHPLRRQWPELFSDDDWERLADQFADRVLAPKPRSVTALGGRGDTDE